MFSAVIESLIKKYCGKFLKKFSSENISIGVTGTLKLTNIEFQTEELGRFQLPYKPIRAFAGEIIADLPFVLGGNFDISVKNMIVVFEKEEHSDVDLDPSMVNAMLQSLISVFYFAYQNPDLAHAKSLSGADLENTQRLFDRFFITLENIHFRLEERFESLLPELEGSSEHMCTGLLFDRIELRPVKAAEKSAHPELYVSSTSKNSLIVDKMIKCTKMSIYCKREDPMCNKAHSEMLTLGQVLNCHYHRESGNILEPLSFDFSFSAGFQKATQVFGPIIIDFKSESIDFSVTDQQIFYLHRVARTVVDHMYKIQSSAWMSFSRSSDVMDRRRMARMRWDMIRKSIKVDWYKYTDKLTSGAMKWRSWFEVWRLAARYVALREILMYHVGYESFTDEETGFVSYAFRENLIMNYTQHICTSTGSEKNNAFVGKGQISEPVLKAAESLIYTQIISNNQYFSLIHSAQSSGRPLVINPFELSTVAIRALYALQLELDSVLPFRVSAYCRILAEEKYKLKQAERKPQLYPEAILEGDIVGGSSPRAAEKIKYTLLVSVIEATKMKASFGSSTVNAYVSLQAAEGWHSGGPLTLTETKTCKASTVSSNAFGLWGNVCSLSVNPALCQHLGVTDISYKESEHDGGIATSITVEAFDRGMFSICYGTANLGVNVVLAGTMPDATNPNSASEYLGEMTTHNLKLTRQAGLFDGAGGAAATEKEGDLTCVRLMTMLVVGNEAVQQNALSKFQTKVKEVVEERKTVLERQQKLEAQESFNSSQGGSAEEDDEVFILDPSVLTVQDIQVQLSCPRVTFQVFGVYVVPPSVREGAVAGGRGEDLPHDANLPLVKLTFSQMSLNAIASNNPWLVKGYGSMETFTVQLMQNDPNAASEGNTELPPPIVSLPRITGSFALTQTSTMGRHIDGKLDMSCFDFNCTASMYPFTVTVNPQSLFSTAATKGRNIWRSVRALDHLWLKEARWAKGTAHSSAIGVDGKPPKKLQPEAMIRLGDRYEAYPKHLNVVTEMWCNAIYGSSNSSSGVTSSGSDLLPKQMTRVKCVAPTRSLDIDINMQPHSRSILPAPLEEIIEANKEASAHLKTYEPPTLFNWFGAVSPSTHAAPAAGTPEAWEAEKKDLLKKIADLEEKNKKLVADKLSRHL